LKYRYIWFFHVECGNIFKLRDIKSLYPFLNGQGGFEIYTEAIPYFMPKNQTLLKKEDFY